MKVPSLDLRAAYLELKDELDAAYQRVTDSRCYILGLAVEQAPWTALSLVPAGSVFTLFLSRPSGSSCHLTTGACSHHSWDRHG